MYEEGRGRVRGEQKTRRIEKVCGGQDKSRRLKEKQEGRRTVGGKHDEGRRRVGRE